MVFCNSTSHSRWLVVLAATIFDAFRSTISSNPIAKISGGSFACAPSDSFKDKSKISELVYLPLVLLSSSQSDSGTDIYRLNMMLLKCFPPFTFHVPTMWRRSGYILNSDQPQRLKYLLAGEANEEVARIVRDQQLRCLVVFPWEEHQTLPACYHPRDYFVLCAQQTEFHLSTAKN